jgi:hypothetical protein
VSASSISRAAADPQLQARIVAAANKEVIFNDELAASWFGQKIAQGMAMWTPLYWSVAVETEAAYETAVNSGRGAPGYDQDIITDAALVSAITANWPEEPPPITPLLAPVVAP